MKDDELESKRVCSLAYDNYASNIVVHLKECDTGKSIEAVRYSGALTFLTYPHVRTLTLSSTKIEDCFIIARSLFRPFCIHIIIRLCL